MLVTLQDIQLTPSRLFATFVFDFPTATHSFSIFTKTLLTIPILPYYRKLVSHIVNRLQG